MAETNAAQTQKKAIRCIDRKGLRGVFVQIIKPTTAPAASTTQRPTVPAPCRGTFMPAQRKAMISRTKNRWSYFQRAGDDHLQQQDPAQERNVAEVLQMGIDQIQRQAPSPARCRPTAAVSRNSSSPRSGGHRGRGQTIGACFRRVVSNSFQAVRAHLSLELRLPQQRSDRQR